MAGPGSPPGVRYGGRQKGTPNKLTATVREMIIAALEKVGGQAYLEQQAKENPVAFMTLVGKVMPTEVVGKDGKDLLPPIKVGFVSIDDARRMAFVLAMGYEQTKEVAQTVVPELESGGDDAC